jgi:ribosomal protein L29
MPELTADKRSATVTAMLDAYRVQLFQAEVDLAANIGNAAGLVELTARIAQLRRGIANVETVFSADVAFKAEPKEEEKPDATA